MSEIEENVNKMVQCIVDIEIMVMELYDELHKNPSDYAVTIESHNREIEVIEYKLERMTKLIGLLRSKVQKINS